MWNLESEMWNYFHITHQSLITKIMGFQRVCAPFGRVLRDSVPESQTNLFVLSRRAKLPLPFKNGEGGEKCDSIPRGGKVPQSGTFRQCFALS